MSGWDEGAVFYSDQAQFPRGSDPDQNNSVTPHAALRKFKEFIRGFHGSKGDFPYR
jgi:DNA replication licensing factor MCM5